MFLIRRPFGWNQDYRYTEDDHNDWKELMFKYIPKQDFKQWKIITSSGVSKCRTSKIGIVW